MGEGLINRVFSDVSDKTSLLIVQLSADYTGKYYSEAARRWVSAPAERPYYLCLMARNATMQRILSDPSRYDIQNLPGFKNFWLFSNATQQISPLYTVLLKDKAKKGTLIQNSDEVKARIKTVHTLESVMPDVVTKTLTIPVAIDISQLYLPESTKTDPAQYEVIGPDGFQIKEISAYGQTDGKPAGYLQTTHKLLLFSKNPVKTDRTITITMRRTFPPRWVAQSHTDDDSQPDTQTTFGLQNLLRGVEEAYNPTHQPTYFKLTLTLNK